MTVELRQSPSYCVGEQVIAGSFVQTARWHSEHQRADSHFFPLRQPGHESGCIRIAMRMSLTT